MKRAYETLGNVAEWLDSERLAVAFTLFYGGFILAFRSFGTSQSFLVLTGGAADVGLWPELVFSGPLFFAASLVGVGRLRRSPLCILLGLVAGFGVFLAALASCVLSSPTGTGVPAYGGITVVFLVLCLRRATGREHGFRP